MSKVTVTDLQWKFADYLDEVSRDDRQIEVTYLDRPGDSVMLIPSAQWAALRKLDGCEVAESKVNYVSITQARPALGALRVSVIEDGMHVVIKRRANERAVMVTPQWLRRAEETAAAQP
ncbi:type II toxin-antitoxin system prevent-host-death family antitoxin [Nocardia blacklockiae]|uniref:type II toxin-antitoxin system prevent-host-death family antitoxin n=1 Tax=Nocardia blacklockiae TaxID=480036 RepID=UPI001894F443|nr:type II toxin-antitoxin system prevent-host-death family antitoxin [Nocardia blacklockiae]MBF6171100.1 type II toxin-antitoxin system prevent-host-death family antitoxin [Nocardia blacklockiae]